MNLLHGIGTPQAETLITMENCLRTQPGEQLDAVLTNPSPNKESSSTSASRPQGTARLPHALLVQRWSVNAGIGPSSASRSTYASTCVPLSLFLTVENLSFIPGAHLF